MIGPPASRRDRREPGVPDGAGDAGEVDRVPEARGAPDESRVRPNTQLNEQDASEWPRDKGVV